MSVRSIVPPVPLLVAALLLPLLRVPQEARATPPDLELLRGLAGRWVGSLRYRDYRSDATVTLPARLEARETPGLDHLVLDLVLEDGKRTVARHEVLVPAKDRLLIHSFGGGPPTVEERRITSRTVTGPTAWSLVGLDEGSDGGTPARFRRTWMREGDRVTFRSETRPREPEDAPWRLRNELVLSRPPAPDPSDLLGTWVVDLRPTPDAKPYLKSFTVDTAAEGRITGSFYDAPIANGRLNADWGALRLAFTTADGSGTYHTTATLRDGRLEGTTHGLGRDFLAVWTATRKMD